VDATIPKGIVGGFEFTVLQRNLKELHKRPWTYVCEYYMKAIKGSFDSYRVGNSVLIITHFFQQPFAKDTVAVNVEV